MCRHGSGGDKANSIITAMKEIMKQRESQKPEIFELIRFVHDIYIFEFRNPKFIRALTEQHLPWTLPFMSTILHKQRSPSFKELPSGRARYVSRVVDSI